MAYPNKSTDDNEWSDSSIVLRLEEYHVSSKYAFLLPHPLSKLPEYFQPWMALAENLEDIIERKTIREKVNQMPLLDHRRLSGHKQLRLASMVLSSLTQGYVWAEGKERVPQILPKQLAVPFAGVSEQLGIPPSNSAANFGLANWKLKNQSQPLTLENLEVIVRLPGGINSSWFFMVYVAVELACGPGLASIVDAQQAVKDNNADKLMTALQRIETSLQNMDAVMRRMPERCEPTVFFNVLRPFLDGWTSAAFTEKGLEGLVYEGVSTKPMKFVGGTAAQSPTIPCFDAALGVQHSNEEKTLTNEFKQYMMPSHRNFIDAIRNGPSIKQYINSRGTACPLLQKHYNKCLLALEEFRSYHIKLVARYIVLMANKNKGHSLTANSNQIAMGTGGTNGLVGFLKNLRDATKEAMIPQQED